MVWEGRERDKTRGGGCDCVCHYQGLAAAQTCLERMGYTLVCKIDSTAGHFQARTAWAASVAKEAGAVAKL